MNQNQKIKKAIIIEIDNSWKKEKNKNFVTKERYKESRTFFKQKLEKLPDEKVKDFFEFVKKVTFLESDWYFFDVEEIQSILDVFDDEEILKTFNFLYNSNPNIKEINIFSFS